MSKLKGSRLMNEVDACRVEGNWQRILELHPTISSKGSGLENLSKFYSGEASLEFYLENVKFSNTPGEQHEQALQKAKSELLSVFDFDDVKPVVIFEANLLLAKLNYCCAKFDDSLSGLNKSKLEQADMEFQNLRSLYLAAEAYAIKGMCLETIPPQKFSNRHQKMARVEKIASCYIKSLELALSYFQEYEKSVASHQLFQSIQQQSNNAQHWPKISVFIETALQRVPVVFIKHGQLDQAVEQYRRMISVLDATASGHQLQQALCRQLAEVLYRGIVDFRYRHPYPVSSSRLGEMTAASFLPLPPLPFFGELLAISPSKSHIFVPSNRLEEIFLLLSISENIGQRGGWQDQLSARSVHNLLIQLLGSLRQFRLLSDMLGSVLRRQTEQDRYLWLQYALCLFSDRMFDQAVSAIQLRLQLNTDNNGGAEADLYLLAARIFAENLGAYDQAIEMAESAYRCSNNAHVKSRCLLLVGLAMSLRVDSRPSTVHLDRSMTRRRPEAVVTVLKRAAVLDPSDYMAEFYLALEYAFDGRLELAECHCRRSFALCQDSPTTAFLLALLLTAKNRLAEALQLVDEAVVEHPRHSALLVLRLKLLVKLSQEDGTHSATERALFAAAKELLLLWRTVQQDPFRSPTPSEMKAPSSGGGNQEQQRCHLLAHSTAHLSAGSGSCTGVGNHNTDHGDHDSTTFTGLTGAATDVGVVAADSGDTSSEDLSLHFSELSMCALSNQARLRGEGSIWLELAEILLQLGMVDEVEQCLAEACNSCCSQTFQILYLKGRVFHVLKQLDNAKACYKTTLSLFAGHTAAIRHLALIYQAEGNYCMAEKLLRDVVRAEPVNCENWFSLAELFSIRQASVEAADCFATALDLYHSSPLIPFSVIPRTLKHL
ncbi:Tetratricopeptide repeat protein 7B [Trichinella papuae]|uniref:Tetratricopeptide repeat protein 7B n=1 Tax=Trichinella papuae TaxID=268474 RepID=A0A0V1NAS4_9BILA|nr:Tetratricopeptide repeat protein 7B [Trichinella papuae]